MHSVFPSPTSACFLLGANIFLTSSGLIKLGDFGCSVKLKNNAQTMPGEVNSTLGTAGGDWLDLSLPQWLITVCLVTGLSLHLCCQHRPGRRGEGFWPQTPQASTCQHVSDAEIRLSLQSERRQESPLFLPRKTTFVVHKGFIKTILVKTQQYVK